MSSGCLPDVFRLVTHLKYSSWQQNCDGNWRDHVQIATKISAYQISCVTRRDSMHRRMWQGRHIIAWTATFNQYTNICVENSRVKSNSLTSFSNVESRRIFISSISYPTSIYHGSSQISVHILHTSWRASNAGFDHPHTKTSTIAALTESSLVRATSRYMMVVSSRPHQLDELCGSYINQTPQIQHT